MQTFLPYEDFAKSASVLDDKRLGKQRVETLQVLNALTRPGYGWGQHPAVKMWRGHVPALMAYQVAVCNEWTSRVSKNTGRNFKDTCLDKSIAVAGTTGSDFDRPFWLGDPALHLSHRSNLLRKDPIHYGPLFPGDPDDLEYVWPV